MADVRLPDGTIIRNVPDDITQEELLRRLNRSDEAFTAGLDAIDGDSFARLAFERPGIVEPTVSNARTFSEFGGRQFADNLLSIPAGATSTAGELLAGTAATAQTVGDVLANALAGRSTDIGDRFRAAQAEQRQHFPASSLINNPIPRPTTVDLQAGAQSLPAIASGNLGASFDENRNAVISGLLSQSSENPIAAFGGELAGDALTIATGRAPIARAGRGVPPLSFPKNIDSASLRLGQKILDMKSVRSLQRGTGRAFEAGLEGAALAIMNEGDPVATAAYAAGLQAAGSATLSATKGVFRRPGRILLAAIIARQVGKSLFPGGSDFILPTIEESFDGLALAMTVGVTAGALGLGRGQNTKLAKLFPEAMDGLAAVPRGAVLSLVEELTATDDGGNAMKVVQQMLEDPDFFGEAARIRLENAIENDSVSLNETINELIDGDPEFARLLDRSGNNTRISQEQLRRDLGNNKGEIIRPGALAEQAARVLGRDRARSLGFDSKGTSSRAFIEAAFGQPDSVETLRKRTNVKRFEDMKVIALESMLFASMPETDGRRVIDGKALLSRWGDLPEASKQSFTADQRDAIEAFIAEATNSKLSGLPPLLAQELLSDTPLSRRLTGRGSPND